MRHQVSDITKMSMLFNRWWHQLVDLKVWC